MNAIFDRYADRLMPDERRMIWNTVTSRRAHRARSLPPWMVPATVSVVAAVVAVITVTHRGERPPAVQPQRQQAEVAPAPAPSRPVVRAPAGAATPPPAGVQQGTPHLPTHALAQALAAEPLGPAAPMAAPATTASAAEPLGPPARIVTPAMPGTLVGRITDEHGQPIAFANVIVIEAKMGTMTDDNGEFRIVGLRPAEYSVQVQALGYTKVVRTGIAVGGEPARADVQVKGSGIVATLEGVQVMGEKRIDTHSSTTKQSITAEKLRGGAPSGDLYGRPSPRPISTTPAPPPVIPTTGGTRLPNDEPFDSMFFKNYGVNPFIPTDEDALSTFAVDVDAASYTVTRRYIELGYLPPADAVRVEEFVNYFPQGYPRFETDDFRILIDGAPSPFGRGYYLLRIGLKGREIGEKQRQPAQLTFVIDVSGSMQREDRLELVKRALRLLVDELRPDDQVGIVVFGSTARVLLAPVGVGHGTGAGRQRIMDAIDQLQPEESTNTEEGLRLGYDMARHARRSGAINRIVLCSDGVANVGRTGAETILAQVRTDADKGIQLTTIGFGMGNYNDVLMEQLADRGDGNHYYVDEIDEARRVFVENLSGTLQTIAKDAKVQVEFDSTRVVRYRLIGFENRDVADRDFRNDKVDAGEIGAGHEVTALYEVKLAPHVTEGALATVRLRYARPEREGAAPRVREIEKRVDVSDLSHRFEDASPRFRLDAAVAECAEILRGSYWAKGSRLSDVLSVARSAARELKDDASKEFVTLVEKAAAIKGRAKPEPNGTER